MPSAAAVCGDDLCPRESESAGMGTPQAEVLLSTGAGARGELCYVGPSLQGRAWPQPRLAVDARCWGAELPAAGLAELAGVLVSCSKWAGAREVDAVPPR